MVKAAEPMTPAQALSLAILLTEFESEGTNAQGWRKEMLEARKVLLSMKQESEITMIYDRNKGTFKGTQVEFDELVNAIVARIKPQLDEAIKSLTIDTSRVRGKKVNSVETFFPQRQAPPLEETLFNSSRNGKVNHQ